MSNNKLTRNLILCVTLWLHITMLIGQKSELLFNAAEYYYALKDTTLSIKYYDQALKNGKLNTDKIYEMLAFLACNRANECELCHRSVNELLKKGTQDPRRLQEFKTCKISIDSVTIYPRSYPLKEKVLFLGELDQAMRTTSYFNEIFVKIDTSYIINELKVLLQSPDLSLDNLDYNTGPLELLFYHTSRYPSFYNWLQSNKIFENLLKKDLISTFFYASNVDNYCRFNNKKQLYGTMWDKNGILPVEDEANIDSRRAKIGLLPLKYDSLVAYQKKQLPSWYDQSKVKSIEFYVQ